MRRESRIEFYNDYQVGIDVGNNCVGLYKGFNIGIAIGNLHFWILCGIECKNICVLTQDIL